VDVLTGAVARRCPADVVTLGGDTFLSPSAAVELVTDAEQAGVRVLG